MDRDFKGIWIPKEVWLNEDLSMQEKIFIVEIDSLDNSEGCFASNKYFADFFKISTTRVSLVIKSLNEKGYIKSKLIYKEGTKEILKRVINICYRPPLTFVKEPAQHMLKDNNTINNTINNNIYSLVIEYLNLKAGTNYKSTTNKTQTLIKARQKEGFKLEDFKKVIDNKILDWKNNDNEIYLRPETLFGTKFEGYLNQRSCSKNGKWNTEHVKQNNAAKEEKWGGYNFDGNDYEPKPGINYEELSEEY